MATINPLGERARGNKWWRTMTAFTLGCILGGAMLGAGAGGLGLLLGLPGMVSHRTAAAIAPALALAAGLAELAGWAVPTVRRQVDEAWLGRYRGWVYGAGFGVQLGAGLATTITTVAVYAMVGIGVVTGAVGRPEWALVLGAGFGLARAVPVLAGWRLRDAARVRRRGARLAAAASVSRLATGSSLCALAVWASVTS